MYICFVYCHYIRFISYIIDCILVCGRLGDFEESDQVGRVVVHLRVSSMCSRSIHI